MSRTAEEPATGNGQVEPKLPTEAEARAALEAAGRARREAFVAAFRKLCEEYRCTLAWREVWVNGALAVPGEFVAVDAEAR